MAVSSAPAIHPSSPPAVAEARQALLDGVGRIFDISPECFDQQAPSAFGIFRWSIEKARESPGVNLNDVIADLPEKQVDKQRVLSFLLEYYDRKKLYRKQVDQLLFSLLQSPSWQEAGINGGSDELSARLQARMAAWAEATSIGSAVGSLDVPSGPPSACGSRMRANTGATESDISHYQDDSEGKSEPLDGIADLDGIACGWTPSFNPSSLTSCSMPALLQCTQEELSTEWFKFVVKQVESLTLAFKEMRQELNILKKSTETLKTNVLSKMEIAIKEVLESHDAHAKDHLHIKDKLAGLDKMVEQVRNAAKLKAPSDDRDDESTRLVLTARIECIEAALGDSHTKQAEELVTISSRLGGLEHKIDASVESMQVTLTRMNGELIKEQALKREESDNASTRTSQAVVSQDTFNAERTAWEAMHLELLLRLEGVEKKLLAHDQVAHSQLLIEKRGSVLLDRAHGQFDKTSEGICSSNSRAPSPVTLIMERVLVTGHASGSSPNTPMVVNRPIGQAVTDVGRSLKPPDLNSRRHSPDRGTNGMLQIGSNCLQASPSSMSRSTMPAVRLDNRALSGMSHMHMPSSSTQRTYSPVPSEAEDFQARPRTLNRYPIHGSMHAKPGGSGLYSIAGGAR